MDRAREWYVHDSAGVHMADFRTSQAEFSTAKTMRVSCDIRPSRYLCFELLPVRHVKRRPQPAFWMTEIRRRFFPAFPIPMRYR